MVPHPISSLQHPSVKKFVKLRESKSFRQKEGTLLIVGETVIREIAKKHRIKTLISAKPLSLPAEHRLIGTEEVLHKIIGHKTDDLVAAEIPLPQPSTLSYSKRILLLDGLGDPGNVGTLFRSAVAFGWDGVFVIEGSADPYNDKALRSSRAAPLLISWREGSWKEAEELIQSISPHVVVADLSGDPFKKVAYKEPLVLVLGHETRGPSEYAKKIGRSITIPMQDTMESLNVAAAGSILLYHLQEAL